MEHYGNKLTFQVKAGEQGLLRNFIRNSKGISRKSLSKIKNEGLILCNDERVTVRHIVAEGDLIEIYYPEEEKSEYLFPEDIPLHILYEDHDILVVNKQADLCMHPTYGQPSGTLANGVLFHWEQNNDTQSGFHAVNRLDRDTSGIVLIAKNRFAKQQLTTQQKDKTLQRSYIALCHGIFEFDKGEVDAPIGRDESHSTKRMVREDGQESRTVYEVVGRFSGYSLVKVTPKTGRTHQIRVHMSYLGHPLMGDDLYGGSRTILHRQALHADYMTFIHPRTEEALGFQLPLAEDIAEALQAIR